jgi:hypothetical protein
VPKERVELIWGRSAGVTVIGRTGGFVGVVERNGGLGDVEGTEVTVGMETVGGDVTEVDSTLLRFESSPLFPSSPRGLVIVF